LAGLTHPSSGEVLFPSDADSGDVPVHYLGHQDSVKAQETVSQQCEFWAKFFGESKEEVRSALEMVGLWKRRDVPGRGLSAGQRRRLSLSRLLISHRPIWLLDEPFAALDTEGQALLKAMVASHTEQGGAVIAAMHGAGFDGAQTLEITRQVEKSGASV